MTVEELLEERNLSTDDAAALLNEHGVTITFGPRKGEPITPGDIRMRMKKPVSRPWRAAFGLEASDPTPSPSPGSETAPPDAETRGRREAPPRRPREAPIQVTDPGARKRIAGAYKFVGAALAAGAGSEGVAEVWSDQSDAIAQLWVDAAAENPWAARFVNMMNAGGAGGDLAAAHLYLVGATFYVLGAGIPGGDAIFSKYSRHRVVAAKPKAEQNGRAAEQPEAAEPAAEGAVVDGLG